MTGTAGSDTINAAAYDSLSAADTITDNSTTDNVDKEGAETLARIVAGASTFTAGQVAFITNSLPYAIPLEYGHSKKAPEGMIRVTVARFEQIIQEAIKGNQI